MVGNIARIRNKGLRKRLTSPEEAVKIIESGMTIGNASRESGVLSAALVKRAQQIKNFGINLWAATVSLEMDRTLGETGIIKTRFGQQTELRRTINAGDVTYCDVGMSKYCQLIRTHDCGSIDVAIAEAIAITKEGNIIPSLNLVEMPSFVAAADKVIIKLNPFYPLEMEGMHDIYLREGPRNRKPIPLAEPGGRVGTPFIRVDGDKIASIVMADTQDVPQPIAVPSEVGKRIAQHLISFFRKEVSLGRLPPNLLPIEMGLGSIPAMVLKELGDAEFENLEFFSAVLGDGVIDLIDLGKVKSASATSLVLSEGKQRQFSYGVRTYRKFIILRPLEISNSPELIARFDVIAVNSVAEIDIYGHGNATHPGGTNVLNGIGGLVDFAEHAFLSILILPSVARNGDISNIVPMVPHVDISEHQVDIIVTEQGWADVRGLPPTERAEKIIEHCAHPSYRPLLHAYFNKAASQVGGHEPHLLGEAFSFHQRFLETESMKRPRRTVRPHSTVAAAIVNAQTSKIPSALEKSEAR